MRWQVLFTLAMLCFLDSMYSLCVVAFIPEIMVKQSPMHAALVFTLFYLGALIGQRLTRSLGTSLGREHILTVGIACLFISSAVSVMAVNGRVHLRMMLFARGLQGLGSAAIQAGDVLLSLLTRSSSNPHPYFLLSSSGALGIVLDECQRADDSTTEDAFASIVTANAFGTAMGPCIGGILFTIKGPTFVFLAFVVFIGLSGILCSFYVSFPDGPLPAVAYESLIQDPAMLVTAGGFSLVYVCMSLLWSTFPIHLLYAFQSKEAIVGLIFTLVLLSHDIFLPIIFSFLEVRSAENRNTYVACAHFMMGSFVVLAYMAKR